MIPWRCTRRLSTQTADGQTGDINPLAGEYYNNSFLIKSCMLPSLRAIDHEDTWGVHYQEKPRLDRIEDQGTQF